MGRQRSGLVLCQAHPPVRCDRTRQRTGILAVIVFVADQIAHTVSCVSAHLRQHVGVGVHRQGNLRVTEDFHDDPRRHTLSQHERCAAVTEIVEPALRKARPCKQCLKRMRDDTSTKRYPSRLRRCLRL
jgi:hypothetical protein